jgi:2-alkyl-3-oxoalkanoate reductase
MKVLVAGATGAIGKPLIDCLIQTGQDTYGITHSENRASILAAAGAKPLVLNVLDREAVFATVAKIRPDVVIDMLTALPKEYTSEAMRGAAETDVKLRLEGGGYLLAAAEAAGVRRYIVQSSAFWYAPGPDLADEYEPFASEATPAIAAGTRVYAEIEKRVLQSNKLEGVALRFGFFYGPGTWYHPDGNMGEQVRKHQVPIIGLGQGVWNWIHIEDAAKAAADAVYTHPGAYNITNNRPSMLNEWLPAFARYLGAPHPAHISEEEGLKLFGPDQVYYATKLRGASNQKIKTENNFTPRSFEWLL